MIDQSIDYDGLMQANLARVFGERDTSRRMKAIAELYADNAILYEPDASATGHAAIGEAVEVLLASLPPSFAFTAVAHHSSDWLLTGQKVARHLSTNVAGDSGNCEHWIGFSLTVERQF